MVQSCAAYKCANRTSKNSNISFHRFPNDPELTELRQKWIIATRRENFLPGKTTALCSDHFRDSDFIFKESKGKSRLKSDAVPSVFNFPAHLMPKIHNSRETKRKAFVNREIETNTELVNPDIPLSFTFQDVSRQPATKRKRKEPRHFGDFKKEDLSCANKTEQMWQAGKKQIYQLRKKIKLLEIRNKRLSLKIKTLTDLVDHLRRSKKVSEENGFLLSETLPLAEKQLLLRQLKKMPRNKYPEQLRSFALTLQFYSPNAYNYVRKIFGNCLPHPSTLRKWLASIDGSPGYTAESLFAIKVKVGELKKDGKDLICGLIMDEMAIKKHVQWDGHRYWGLVDFGCKVDTDALPEAKEALVFLLVGLNTRWKIPIAYFLVAGLSASQKAGLVKGCLKMVHDSGAKIVSLTFDGTVTNFCTATILGAKLQPPNIRPWFLHPFNKHRVHIFLDACHMVKLVRNALHEWKSLYAEDNNKVNWQYFEHLVELQESTGLHAANKLTRRHLNFKNEIMKVRLAVQLFSGSVADALDFCNSDLKLDNFKNSQGTANFFRIINNIFDILNTRNYLSKNPWRRPFNEKNECEIKKYLHMAKCCITSLRDCSGNSVLICRRKTGFIGLLVCMESLENLFNDCVKNSKNLDFILSYKLSQDHIEMFFSAIRSRGGFTNNPTAIKFQGAYKRLLLHAEITTSAAANCISQEHVAILSVSSSSKPKIDDLILMPNELREELVIDELHIPNSEYINDVVEYIAGFVSRKVVKIIHCNICVKYVLEDSSGSTLLNRKNRGGLCKATVDVVKICRAAEQVIRSICNFPLTPNINKLIILAGRKLHFSSLFQALETHILDQDPLNNHSIQMIQIILKIYFTIRIHHINKRRDEKDIRVRHKYSKLILFKNQ